MGASGDGMRVVTGAREVGDGGEGGRMATGGCSGDQGEGNRAVAGACSGGGGQGGRAGTRVDSVRRKYLSVLHT